MGRKRRRERDEVYYRVAAFLEKIFQFKTVGIFFISVVLSIIRDVILIIQF